MDQIEFYDLKNRKKIKINLSFIIKTIVKQKQRTLYRLRAKTPDGRLLSKFVTKEDWDKIDVPVSR